MERTSTATGTETSMHIDRRWALVALCVLCLACGPAPSHHGHDHGDGHTHGDGHDDHGASEGNWMITAWGSHFEVFPEIGALVVGKAADAYVHVTRLEGFEPLSEGSVHIVLSSDGGEEVFHSAAATRPGIFTLQITPDAAGDFDLAFRIDADGLQDEIRGGRVRVGSMERPGGIVVAPAPKGGDGGEPMDFLKEEQWGSDFATSWVRRGELPVSVEGLVRVRPPAGGEALLSSPIDGIVRASGDWPYVGRRIARGGDLFRVVPRVAIARSLADLEAEAASLDIEATTHRQRLKRLEELLELEATSLLEVEEARHHLQILDARQAAAHRDLEGARSARQGGQQDQRQTFPLAAPFDGAVAEVSTTPGATVVAGEPLARLVRTDTVWLDVALSPVDAARLASSPNIRGVVLAAPGRPAPVRLDTGLQLVSMAPEANPVTGTRSVLLESKSDDRLVLGTSLQGTVLLAETRPGIVVPASALVDDGGVSVVYLQLSGESFLRQEVQILERQGNQVLVEGLEPGQRLVQRGGNAIRRSSLMSSGGGHGHVH